MADTYRLIAGILIFVIFISVMLSWVASSFPDLAPGGTSPLTEIPNQQPVFTVNSTSCNDWTCGISNFLKTVGNGIVTGAKLAGGLISMFGALLTFQIPALQVNPFTQLINFLIVVPIIVVLVYMSFRIIKSVIPTVGGDAD